MSAILIIEDDSSVQRAISKPLEQAGHRVVIVAEPLIALDLLEYPNIHFDLIIADVASFRYAHHQNTLGLLYRRANDLGSHVLACTTRGEMRISGRFSNLPNPLLTARFLRLVTTILRPDVATGDEPSSEPAKYELLSLYHSDKLAARRFVARLEFHESELNLFTYART